MEPWASPFKAPGYIKLKTRTCRLSVLTNLKTCSVLQIFILYVSLLTLSRNKTPFSPHHYNEELAPVMGEWGLWWQKLTNINAVSPGNTSQLFSAYQLRVKTAQNTLRSPRHGDDRQMACNGWIQVNRPARTQKKPVQLRRQVASSHIVRYRSQVAHFRIKSSLECPDQSTTLVLPTSRRVCGRSHGDIQFINVN